MFVFRMSDPLFVEKFLVSAFGFISSKPYATELECGMLG